MPTEDTAATTTRLGSLVCPATMVREGARTVIEIRNWAARGVLLTLGLAALALTILPLRDGYLVAAAGIALAGLGLLAIALAGAERTRLEIDAVTGTLRHATGSPLHGMTQRDLPLAGFGGAVLSAPDPDVSGRSLTLVFAAERVALTEARLPDTLAEALAAEIHAATGFAPAQDAAP